MSDKIKVRITAEHKVYYATTVEMTPREYDRLNSALSSGKYEALDAWIDYRADVSHSDDLEDGEIRKIHNG